MKLGLRAYSNLASTPGGKAWYRLFAHVQYYPNNLVIVYLRIFPVNYTVNYSYTRVGYRILSMNIKATFTEKCANNQVYATFVGHERLSLESKQQDGTQLLY